MPSLAPQRYSNGIAMAVHRRHVVCAFTRCRCPRTRATAGFNFIQVCSRTIMYEPYASLRPASNIAARRSQLDGNGHAALSRLPIIAASAINAMARRVSRRRDGIRHSRLHVGPAHRARTNTSLPAPYSCAGQRISVLDDQDGFNRHLVVRRIQCARLFRRHGLSLNGAHRFCHQRAAVPV